MGPKGFKISFVVLQEGRAKKKRKLTPEEVAQKLEKRTLKTKLAIARTFLADLRLHSHLWLSYHTRTQGSCIERSSEVSEPRMASSFDRIGG